MSKSTIHAQDEYVIFDKIQGEWQVGELKSIELQPGDGLKYTYLGTLLIRDSSYIFLPRHRDTASVGMKKRFTFFDQRKGTFVVDRYRVKPEDSIEDLEDHDIIANCRFNNQTESFLVRFDQEKNQLYFHATMNEFQYYKIIRRL
ncbi:MAG: hypothetical protein QNK23_09355 [Crocinitomicaceae bacterium]|nr:hypothetical protein [Crocinitomicaceae bacterium]